ncbi:hypothetical protein COU92_01995 [Candidatus Saccharibacteria bacterium CG10_big_fil_rev_8_21_14_0_10_41_32]|nr:MAG: hypothetical protein COU92_01995 [Candidatus Saccharibacteria bacterium CG10_big_fil_rev_8_21_14_0_10_41_32]
MNEINIEKVNVRMIIVQKTVAISMVGRTKNTKYTIIHKNSTIQNPVSIPRLANPTKIDSSINAKNIGIF